MPDNSSHSDDTSILVVEDENDLADMYAAYLDDDYRVSVAYSGQEALDKLDESFDIVLLDRRMPVVSGNEVVKPVSRTDVEQTVDRLLTLDEYNERMQVLTSKKLKRNVLEVEKTKAELSESEEFQRLNEEIEELSEEVDAIAEELDVDHIKKQM